MYESDKYWKNTKTSPVYARQSTRSLSGCVLEFVSVLAALNRYFVPNPIVFEYFPCIEVSYGHFLPGLYYLACIMFLLSLSTPCSFCSVNVVMVSIRELRKQSRDIPSFITLFINALYWIMPRFW